MRRQRAYMSCRDSSPSAAAACSLAAMLMALTVANGVRADLTLVYSFEDGDPQGFGPNGGGVTVEHDTFGATHGTGSLKMDIVQGATFVGALTGSLAPEIGDPPGMEVVVFDLTITEAFPAICFVDAGITVFGATQSDYPGGQLAGLQAQFFGNQFSLGDLPPGTHEVQMELTSAVHPLTFQLASFNDIFGVEGSGPNDIIPSGFQIYINKSTQAPWTGYIDNIRVGTLPAGPDADFNNDAIVNGDDLVIWRGAFGTSPAGDADGDMDSDGQDFLIWQQQVGPVPPGAAAIPEPAGLVAAGLGLVLTAALRRGRPMRR